MIVSHSSMSIRSQKGKKKLDEEKKNEETEISMIKVKGKEVSPTSDEEVEKGLHTPPLLYQLGAQAIKNAKLCGGKDLDEEKMRA